MHRSGLDLLLVQLPNLKESAYLIGVASLKAFLSVNGFNVRCLNPAKNLIEKLPEDQRTHWTNLLSNTSEFSPPPQIALKELIQQLDQEILSSQPKHLGFSVLFGNLTTTLMVAEEIKKRHPKLPILLGGPGVMLKVQEEKMGAVSDFIFYGDSEFSLLEYLQGKNPKEILGLAWKTSSGWQKNAKRPTPKDLSLFPQPDYSDFETDSHAQTLLNPTPITLGRGCPFRCKFCSVKNYGLEYRHFSVESCLSHLQKQVEMGKTNFYVHDPITNGNPGWIREFARAIVRANLKIQWGGNIRLAKYLLETETLDLLFESGFRTMITGMESASPNVLKHMRKFADLDSIQRIFQKIHQVKEKYDLQIFLQLIVGYPTETEEDFQMTLDFVKAHRNTISEVASCSSFLIIPSENDEMLDLIQDPSLRLKFVTDSNWSTPHSNPSIRLNRMKRAERLFQELNLPHRMFYMDRLEQLARDQLTRAQLDKDRLVGEQVGDFSSFGTQRNQHSRTTIDTAEMAE